MTLVRITVATEPRNDDSTTQALYRDVCLEYRLQAGLISSGKCPPEGGTPNIRPSEELEW